MARFLDDDHLFLTPGRREAFTSPDDALEMDSDASSDEMSASSEETESTADPLVGMCARHFMTHLRRAANIPPANDVVGSGEHCGRLVATLADPALPSEEMPHTLTRMTRLPSVPLGDEDQDDSATYEFGLQVLATYSQISSLLTSPLYNDESLPQAIATEPMDTQTILRRLFGRTGWFVLDYVCHNCVLIADFDQDAFSQFLDSTIEQCIYMTFLDMNGQLKPSVPPDIRLTIRAAMASSEIILVDWEPIALLLAVVYHRLKPLDAATITLAVRIRLPIVLDDGWCHAQDEAELLRFVSTPTIRPTMSADGISVSILDRIMETQKRGP